MLICVGIPTIDGKPYTNLVDSLLAEQLIGFQQGVHILVQWEVGCSMIGVARNKLAKRFLDTKGAAAMVFVDSDISWKGGDLIRLALRPEDVVGATYRAKRDDDYFHVRGTPRKAGDLYKVDGLPGGFIKISRRAYERIPANRYKDLEGVEWADYFPTGFYDGTIWGEDYGFCRQWREAGGDVWLDPSIHLRHHDGLKFYTGDPVPWLESAANA